MAKKVEKDGREIGQGPDAELPADTPLRMRHWQRRLYDPADPTPVELAGRLEKPTPIREVIQQMVRRQLHEVAARLDAGTFDEEDDFELDEPEEFVSAHEMVPETPEQVDPSPPAEPAESLGPDEIKRLRAHLAALEKNAARAPKEPSGSDAPA